MTSNKIQMQHKVCSSEANGLTNVTNVKSDTKQMPNKVCASEVNGLSNVTRDKIQMQHKV